ncbi:DUF2442 domain-containing protein [Sphingomonas lenta]|uniref:DUF2442 domain-containing protein n=1 Tax=Sphingomonas lenta TaxID=1141887 RepID=A0A2A2SIZ5_9SPHN|nr:DUF2442 domain-containing protein [Sphingomonas lenta]PAX09193.1 hypothetical protein CKY28_07075 [Sphingomonas lenta]
MMSSARATAVEFDEHMMWVTLEDGRELGVPLAWYPRLLNGTPASREQVTISAVGLHWDELDEDLSVQGLLNGRPSRAYAAPLAA